MKESSGKQLAKKMLIALVCGLVAGFGCILLREHLNSSGQADLWKTINNIFFQDISAEGATSTVGIFYIIGQVFVNSLQLIIVPMVFVSITLAICTITDTKKLGNNFYFFKDNRMCFDFCRCYWFCCLSFRTL